MHESATLFPREILLKLRVSPLTARLKDLGGAMKCHGGAKGAMKAP